MCLQRQLILLNRHEFTFKKKQVCKAIVEANLQLVRSTAYSFLNCVGI